MAHIEHGGSPHGALEPRRNTQQEAGEAGATLSALFMHEQQGGRERSHEELVAIIRNDLAAYIARKKLTRYDPVAVMRERFLHAFTDLELAQNPEPNPGRGRYEMPHAQLMMAWDLVSQPYYKSAYHRGLAEVSVRDDARHLGHTITLDPNESKFLSAMAEAVGIPNPFGQTPQEKKEGR